MKVRRLAKFHLRVRHVPAVPEEVTTVAQLIDYAATVDGLRQTQLLRIAQRWSLEGRRLANMNFEGAGGLRPKKRNRRITGGRK